MILLKPWSEGGRPTTRESRGRKSMLPVVSLLRLALFSIFYVSSIHSFQSTRTTTLPLCPNGATFPKSTTTAAALIAVVAPLQLSNSGAYNNNNNNNSTLVESAGKTEPKKQQQRSKRAIQWEKNFGLLCTYRDREGNANVPRAHQEGGENLGAWLCNQRSLYKSGKLDQDRFQKLESVGVVWEQRPSGSRTTSWDKMFAFLATYQQENGDCNVPRDYKVTNAVAGKEISLGSWVDRQRNANKRGSLVEYRINKLEQIGFEWDRDTSRWNEMFSLLSVYRKREGHCNVPVSYKIDTGGGSRNLGRWLGTQRQEKRKGTLDESRQSLLENLGVEWNVFEEDWRKMLGLLEMYREREGHCLVPTKHIEEGKALGVWLNNVRWRAKRGNLRPAESRALEDLGVVLDGRAQKWDEMLALLVRYKKENGNCMVPRHHNVNGRNLGTWLNTQRQLNRDGSLLPSKQIQLEELGVVWDVRKWKWDQMLALLLEYQKREGDCMVPQRHEENGKNLGSWLDAQRQLQKKGALEDDKISQLEAIGVVWDVPDFNQEEMVNSLLGYKEREGDCNVPASHIEDGKSLGSWLNRQRRLRAAGKLDPSLFKKLEAVGVIWGINEQKWEAMFALLDRFQKREGHCRVPQNHLEGKDEKKLGTWLDYQRYKKKNGKLGATKQTRMEELGVEWNIYAKFDDDDGDDWGFAGMDHLFDDEDMYT